MQRFTKQEFWIVDCSNSQSGCKWLVCAIVTQRTPLDCRRNGDTTTIDSFLFRIGIESLLFALCTIRSSSLRLVRNTNFALQTPVCWNTKLVNKAEWSRERNTDSQPQRRKWVSLSLYVRRLTSLPPCALDCKKTEKCLWDRLREDKDRCKYKWQIKDQINHNHKMQKLQMQNPCRRASTNTRKKKGPKKRENKCNERVGNSVWSAGKMDHHKILGRLQFQRSFFASALPEWLFSGRRTCEQVLGRTPLIAPQCEGRGCLQSSNDLNVKERERGLPDRLKNYKGLLFNRTGKDQMPLWWYLACFTIPKVLVSPEGVMNRVKYLYFSWNLDWLLLSVKGWFESPLIRWDYLKALDNSQPAPSVRHR